MILFGALDRNGYTTGERDAGCIGNVTGLCDQDFITGVDDSADCNVKRLGHPGGNDHLVICRVV